MVTRRLKLVFVVFAVSFVAERGAAQFSVNGAEDTPALCSDGVDNDRDGNIDCADPKCKSSNETCGLLAAPIALGIGEDRPRAASRQATSSVRTVAIGSGDLVGLV